MSILTRSAKITYQIIEGQQVLEYGAEQARHLWNQMWWHCFGYNEKLRRQRGDDWSRYKRNQSYNRSGEGYPGKFALDKEMRQVCQERDISLSDRCFSYTVKDFDIAIRSWFSNLKNNSDAKPPRYCKAPRILNFELGRNAKSIAEWTYRLTVLGGRDDGRHATIKLNIRPGIKMRDIRLIRLQLDGSGVVTYQVEQSQTQAKGIAAIDLGIINIATVAFQNGESILVSGKGLLTVDQWANKQAAKCKPKEWAKGKQQKGQSKRFKAYRYKVGNIRNLAVHNITRHIINECINRDIGTIVIGDLKGIREDADHGKRGNQRLHAWPFAEFKRQLEYKGEEVGIEIIAVSERNTSKCCHLCGQVGQRKPRGLLTCKDCGIVINSDVNGAFNILNKVSPLPAYAERGAGIGVGAIFPGLPSPNRITEICDHCPSDKGPGKVQSRNGQISQISPTFVAKFDLRNWSIVQTRCNG
jgi:putative transposase